MNGVVDEQRFGFRCGCDTPAGTSSGSPSESNFVLVDGCGNASASIARFTERHNGNYRRASKGRIRRLAEIHMKLE